MIHSHAERVSRRSCLVALAVALALSATASPAWAQDRAAARQHFADGERHYAAGEWSEALTEYQAANDAAPMPEFLFNMAQCHRQLGHHADAMAMYQQFLAERPDAPNRQTVEELIDEARAQASAAQATPAPPGADETPAPETTPAPADATAPPPAPADRPSPLARIRVTTWAALGGSALLFTLSGLFALDAGNAESDLADPNLNCRARLSRCLDLQDRGDRSSVLRNTFFVVGLAALAGTGVLAFLDLSRSSDDRMAILVPAISPNAVALAGVFTWR